MNMVQMKIFEALQHSMIVVTVKIKLSDKIVNNTLYVA